MQVQAQLNRIAQLSREASSYRRLRRAAEAVERDRDYKVYNGENLSVLTRNQAERAESMKGVVGRANAIARAASGQSAG